MASTRRMLSDFYLTTKGRTTMAKQGKKPETVNVDWIVCFPDGEVFYDDDSGGPKIFKSEAAAIKFAKERLRADSLDQVCVYKLTHAVERPPVEPVVLQAR